jgi:GAF domain-containing protein
MATAQPTLFSLGATVPILDAETDPDHEMHEARRLGGYHVMFGVPLLREGNPIGVLALARRSEAEPRWMSVLLD